MPDGTGQTGTAIVAGDEITTDNGVAVTARQAQRVKIDRAGVDGAFTDVSPTNPFPVYNASALPAGTNNIGDVDVLTLPAIPAGANVIGFTRDASDLNRVVRNFIFDTPTASPAAETLMSLAQWYNNAAVAATTTPAVVPAGKVLRITGMRVNTASLAAAGMVVLRLRANTAGVVAVTSPLVASLQCGSQAAVAALQDNQIIEFPEGIDFPAGTGVGLTHQGYVGATGTLQSFTRAEMWGYEYTA